MSQSDVARFLQRRPFEAFRIVLSDGKEYEIRHPEMAIAAPTTVVVGTPSPDEPGAALRYDLVSMFHIVRLEPLPAAVQGNGN